MWVGRTDMRQRDEPESEQPVSGSRSRWKLVFGSLLYVLAAVVVVLAVIGSLAIPDRHLPCPRMPCLPAPGSCPPCPTDHRNGLRVLVLAAGVVALAGLIWGTIQ